MNGLERYPKLTLRISREPLLLYKPSQDNGHSYRYFIRCDEIPGCCAHGATINDALKYFEDMAELWSRWFDNVPSSG